MLTLILLTILIIENLLLLVLLLIWLNRHCKQCQQVKCLERTLNKLCQNCNKEPQKPKVEL